MRWLLDRLAKDAIAASPLLRNFSSKSHEEAIRAFKEADEKLKTISQEEIAAALHKRRVPRGRTGRRVGDLTEKYLLRREARKQGRHLPIRTVLRRAGRALQALKPCFMMGPLSVAQYLKPGGLTFDLVIMDEASQMRPEDALGAVARGKQLIVVGDPKQLPPTSFFDRIDADDGDGQDDALTFGSQESILDIATPLFQPARTLRWHYRSQHESLIAFSNHSFYRNKLLLFPTAHSSAEHLGLEYRRVDGVYENQTNVAEAQELVRAAVRELRSGRNRSIGLAAINSAQAQVIRDEWDRVTREFPDLAELLYEDEDNLEPLFIKNLENVQGDERDVIFVSLTYGRDRNGGFFQRFGPINRDDGWRRLNVLFTRAKQKMVIFSSMDSHMITPSENANRGVVALRDFLSYCETRVLPETPSVSGRGPDSPFEEDVAAAVREYGLEAHCQVGVAGFFIDIGVTDPARPGQYLLGIECDGASYHSRQSVRDRDKIRQSILEKLGWRIHRIWSTDWFRNQARERQRLEEILRSARANAQQLRERVAEDAAEPTPQPVETIVPIEEADEARPQESAPPSDDLRQKLLDLRSTMDEEFPDTPPEHCLLSDDIIDALLTTEPTTPAAFHRTVPIERRREIDREQARVYLSTVLMVIQESR